MGEGRSGERLKVESWRFQQALGLGVHVDLAEGFAQGDGDLNLLRQLIAGGCDPNLAAQIA